MENWDPQLGQCLLLRREPGNSCDEHACSCCPERELLLAMYLITWYLLSKKGNKQRLPGSYHGKVNRGAGYGFEVPHIY